MHLIIQPDDGFAPLLQAIRQAEQRIDVLIFRLDLSALLKALESAVARGVVVRALIAHTNRGGEKALRKLEMRLLDAGVTVARTGDDLLRYHGKMLIADDTLYVFGFNFTKLDVGKSRSFGISTRDPKLVKEAVALFDADSTRQPYTPGHDRFVVSPENARRAISGFVEGARRQLLIYDGKLTDPAMLRLLRGKLKEGLDVRVIGKVSKTAAGLEARKLPGVRLHVRAIVRDGEDVFVGSQSLRKLELDGRREVGLIVSDRDVVTRVAGVFEADWASALSKDRVEAKGEPSGERAQTLLPE